MNKPKTIFMNTSRILITLWAIIFLLIVVAQGSGEQFIYFQF